MLGSCILPKLQRFLTMTLYKSALYFFVSAALSLMVLLFKEDLQVLETELYDADRKFLAGIVSCSLFAFAALFLSFYDLMRRLIQRSSQRLYGNIIYSLGIAFFLFMISLIWFVGGVDLLSAAIFRLEHFKYEWIAAHLGGGFILYSFFYVPEIYMEAEKTRLEASEKKLWLFGFLAAFHLWPLLKYHDGPNTIGSACSKIYGSGFFKHPQDFMDGIFCGKDFETGKQVYEQLLIAEGFSKADIYGVDALFYCLAFLSGLILKSGMTIGFRLITSKNK